MNTADLVKTANDQITGLNKSGGFNIPVITATGLQDNSQPMTITQPTPSTAGSALGGAIDTHVDTWTKQLSDATANAKTAKDTSLEALISELTAPGKAQNTDAAYKAAGVDTAQKDLNDTNNAILAERNALNQRIASLKANKEGFFGTGLDQEIQKVTDESNARQANLAVIQLAKQGAFDSAKAIADRAVAAATEAKQNKITALQAIYEANKGEFTTAEQQQFESMQAERQSKLDEDKQKRLMDYEALIKQHATATTGTSALTGQAGYASLTSSQKTKADSLNDLITNLNIYRKSYNDLVGGTGAKLTGKDAALLASQLNSLMFAAAQAEGTGALQAADREVLEKVLPNPTSLTGAASAILRGGKEGGLSQLDQQIAKYTSNLGHLGLTPTDPAAPAPQDTQIPQEGDTHVYNGVTYVVKNGVWTPK